MLPRWHVFFGAIFSIFFWILIPSTKWYFIFLIFSASFLIDFDHYLNAVYKTGKIGLRNAFEYHKRLSKEEDKKKSKKQKGDFEFFHTLEFQALIGLLSFFWVGFFYIFLGMVFHSLTDLIYLIKKGKLYRREFFFFNWLRNKIY